MAPTGTCPDLSGRSAPAVATPPRHVVDLKVSAASLDGRRFGGATRTKQAEAFSFLYFEMKAVYRRSSNELQRAAEAPDALRGDTGRADAPCRESGIDIS